MTMLARMKTMLRKWPRVPLLLWLLSGMAVGSYRCDAASGSVAVSVNKGQCLVQEDSTAPVLEAGRPFVFEVVADSEDNTFTRSGSVTVSPPDGRPQITLAASNGFAFSTRFNTKSELDESFPNGTYQIIVKGRGPDIRLDPRINSDHYPSAPYILNFADAQAISPTGEFALMWPQLTGPTLQDFISLVVSNKQNPPSELFSTYESSLIPDQAPTSLTIPANTLPVGPTNTAVVTFFRAVSFRQSADNSVWAGAQFFSRTELPIRATDEPFLRVTALDEFGAFRFRFNATPGRDYRVEAAATFDIWEPIELLTADEPYEEVTDFDSTFRDHRFYRVVQVP